MEMMRLIALVLVLTVLAAGCGRRSATTASGPNGSEPAREASPSANSGLVGEFKGEPWVDPKAKPEEKQNAAMAKGMIDSFGGLSLSLKNEGHFKMTLLGIDLEGLWKRTGDRLSLEVTTVAGMDPKRFAKEGAKMKDGATVTLKSDFSEPLVMQVEDGGKSLRWNPTPAGGGDPLIFKRQAS